MTTRALAPVGAGATDIGPREHNEDHVLLRPELGLFLLADGAGGHNAGNVASALATTTVANIFETTAKSLGERPEIDEFGLWTMARRLSAAIHRANVEIIDIAKKSKKYQGMGTTIVALAFSPEGDVIHVAHVGDSRCYRLRAGVLEPLTMDHSLVVDVLETHPDADDSLVARMPQHVDHPRARHGGDAARARPDACAPSPGDLYLLCSDGLSGALDDDRIETLLSEKRPPIEQVRALSRRGARRGTRTTTSRPSSSSVARPTWPRRGDRRSRPLEALVRPPSSARAPLASAPEIIIVGVETHVVPTNSASANLLDALGRFSRLRQPSAPEIAEPKPARCGDCGQPLEKGADFCPTCGAKFSV